MRAIQVNRKNKNPRASQLMADIIHVVICICIVILAVLAFLDPAGHMIVYPIIFFLAAVLNGIEAAGKLKRDYKGKNRKVSGMVFVLLTAALLVLTVISAVSVWG